MPKVARALVLITLFCDAVGAAYASSVSYSELSVTREGEAALVSLGSAAAGPRSADSVSAFSSHADAQGSKPHAGEVGTGLAVPMEVPLPGSGLLFLVAILGLIGRRVRTVDSWRTRRPS